MKNNCRHTFYDVSLAFNTAPNTPLCRASVTHTGDSIHLLNISSIRHTAHPHMYDYTSYDAITLKEPAVKWCMENISHSESTSELLSSIQSGKILAASDGSFYPDTQTGACGWIVATMDGQEWIQGGGILPGEKTDQNSYRSELGGQIGIASFFHSILVPPSPTPTSCQIISICDNVAALNKVGTPSHSIQVKEKHIDL